VASEETQTCAAGDIPRCPWRRQADQEVEGRVSYPKPYNPAVTAQDDDDGVVSYPQASVRMGWPWL